MRPTEFTLEEMNRRLIAAGGETLTLEEIAECAYPSTTPEPDAASAPLTPEELERASRQGRSIFSARTRP